MSISQIIPIKIERTAIQTIGRLVVKLGYISRNAYEQLNMLYLLEEKNWKTAKKIFGDLMSEEEIMLLDMCFREYMYVEFARKKGMITKQKANQCMQKRFGVTKEKKLIENFFVEKDISVAELKSIQNELERMQLIDKKKLTPSKRVQLSQSKISKLKTIKRFQVGEQIFSKYKVLAEIGQGGMGRVYKVKDSEDRIVALKILTNLQDQQNNYKRFTREANLMSQLRHPNIVSVHEFEEQNGIIFYTMDFVDGVNLNELIEKRKITIDESIDIVQKIAEAAAYAHQYGIIHRDIKPSNIMVNGNGEPLLMDFGLAKVIEGNEKISQTGAILGTPVYMSPEQASGRLNQVNALSDIYSIGALFYEILTGEMPFKGSSSLAVILQVLNRDPIPPKKLSPQIPKPLENICLKAMNKKPTLRYETGYALAQDLNNFKSGGTVVATAPGIFSRAYKHIMRNQVMSFPIIAVVVMSIFFFAYSYYKDYRLLFDLQECTSLILDIQQITPKNAAERDKMANKYIKTFTSHIERNSKNSAAYLGRAVCYIIKGQYRKALKDLDETIDLAKNSPFPLEMLYLVRAQCFIDYGNYKPAIDDLKKIKKVDKWIWVGVIYKNLGDHKTALKVFNKIIQHQKHYEKGSILFANVHKAEILMMQGNIEEAKIYAQKAIDIIPYLGGSNLIAFYASSAYNTIAAISIEEKKFPKAHEYLQEALKWYPSDETTYRAMAVLESKRGNSIQAKNIFVELVKYEGQIHYTYYQYATHYARLNNTDKALELLKKSFEKGFRDFTKLELETVWKSISSSETYQEMITKYKSQIPTIDFKIK